MELKLEVPALLEFWALKWVVLVAQWVAEELVVRVTLLRMVTDEGTVTTVTLLM